MRKLLLVTLLLLVVINFVATDVVLAGIKFGSWEKWDEELPPLDSKYWYWVSPEQKTVPIKYGAKTVVLVSCLYFGTIEKDTKNALTIFYSVGTQEVNIKKDYIPDPKYALTLFPSEKRKTKIIVRAYEREYSIFKFIEEWKMPFKDMLLDKNLYEIVRYDVKFRDIFNDWLWSQELPPESISASRGGVARIENLFLPILRIDKTGTLMIFWKDEMVIW